jgi:hypothetical protein
MEDVLPATSVFICIVSAAAMSTDTPFMKGIVNHFRKVLTLSFPSHGVNRESHMLLR